MNTIPAKPSAPIRARWSFLVGLLFLLSPILTPLFVLPIHDPRRRTYLFFGGMSVAILEVVSFVLLWRARREMKGASAVLTLLLCCVAGLLAFFFAGLAQP